MKDLLLDLQTHDLVIDRSDLQMVEGVEYVRQKLKIRLLFFLSEWFLDTEVGVPYFDRILVKNPDLGTVEAILTDAILATPYVNSLLSIDLTYEASFRQLTVRFEVDTDFGPVTVESIG